MRGVRREAHLISSIVALTAFVIALATGFAVGNPADTILVRAVMCMIGARIGGFLIGLVCERVLSEHLESYRATRPIPQVDITGKRQAPEPGKTDG